MPVEIVYDVVTLFLRFLVSSVDASGNCIQCCNSVPTLYLVSISALSSSVQCRCQWKLYTVLLLCSYAVFSFYFSFVIKCPVQMSVEIVYSVVSLFLRFINNFSVSALSSIVQCRCKWKLYTVLCCFSVPALYSVFYFSFVIKCPVQMSVEIVYSVVTLFLRCI